MHKKSLLISDSIFLILLWAASLLLPLAAAASECSMNYTRPIRIGMIAPFESVVGPLLVAASDGARLAIDEANADDGIGGRSIDLILVENDDDDLNMPNLIHSIMTNASTELDTLIFMPYREHIDASMPMIRHHGLLLMGALSGERGDFNTFDPHKGLISPIPDSEVEVVTRFLILERRVKRIAIATTFGFTFGKDLIPYVSKLLEEFGLQLVYQFTIEDPLHSVAEQLAEAAPLKIQALFVIANIDEFTAMFVAQFASTFPNAYLASVGFIFVVIYQLFEAFPMLLADGRVTPPSPPSSICVQSNRCTRIA